MTHRSQIAITAILLLLSLGLAAAVYEDQKDQHGWLHQYLGKVTLSSTSSAPRTRLYVATDANAVAALSPKDGSVVWKRAFATGDTVQRLEAVGTAAATLSGGGRFLRSFDGTDGRLLFERSLAHAVDSGEMPDMAAITASGRPALLAVALGSAVQAIDPLTGSSVWTSEGKEEQGRHEVARLYSASGSNELTLVSLADRCVEMCSLTAPFFRPQLFHTECWVDCIMHRLCI